MRFFRLRFRTRTVLVLVFLLSFTGCSGPDYRDQRLAEFAQQSTAEQAQQNARMASQAEAIVKQSHQVAEAAKELVQQDAEARREMITAHAQLAGQLQSGHEQLEQDRRNLAQQRHRDSVVAATIQSLGILMASLLPLLVTGLVLWRMQQEEPEHAAVAELLVSELTSEKPLFLPASVAPRLTAPSESQASASDESDNPREYPF